MKQIKFLIVLVVAVFVSSCEDTFLTPDLTTGISSETFFTTEAEVESAVVNMYDGIQGFNASKDTDSGLNHAIQVEFYVTEMRSDNTRTKSQEGEAAQFEFYTIASTNGIVADYYRSYYNVIYRANLVLANLETAGSKSAQFEAEAKFVRAYAYFNLVRLFGDVPLIDKVIAPLDKTTSFTRVASSITYDLIVSDLQTAISNLDDTYKDRASKAGAEGLLAKVFLTLGRYGEAQVLLESIMNPSRGFGLESNFKDIFYNEGNKETIFAIGFLPGVNDDSQNFSAEWLNSVGRGSGVNYVTEDARTVLDALGGNRTALSYRQDVEQPTQYQVVKYLPNGDVDLEIPVTSPDPTSAGNDWIVLRYADVLLMHVEAILANSASTTSTTAITSFNQIRSRAGFTGSDLIATDGTGSISKQELLDERRVELAFENHRFFDLVRMGAAQTVLSDFASATGGSFSSNDLLLPIPQIEIGLSPEVNGESLLKQNPGY